ncbi:putative cupin superfamily protein [Rhizobium leguminosarum]|uniref:Cupin superfamily protein n=1 Tax=Rhizobium leguminosarum TaxID=384 RepID=A0AAE2T0W5_RHILE|nr:MULTISPECIES: cupin domain-containing protein [Rhizobium]MBB4293998.1 putative cupin superfamily protein [Rhizobium leguminosarum]MBB4300391.1 putative cupin superfamily protein [Rhizobium leguminosarum]MBB4311686.1 putative cupin superfamily protein [Rhizobium leguminosarum]MBB4420674.1 putative cupin superfamily protein [Rhizobium leguminosarum]MBB4435894.1 putative cupin superfamily protein [Rhizobium esperanzae]
MTGKTILLFEAKSGSAPEGTRNALGPDDIFGAGRDIAWSASGGVSAGSVHWNGKASIASFPHTESLVVVSGRLVLQSSGLTVHLTPGDSVVIGRGEAITAEAEKGTRWIFCATTAATLRTPGMVAIDRDVALAPSAPPLAQFVEGNTPQCSQFRAYLDEAAGFRAGVWATTPHVRLSRPHPVHELMYILEGQADVTDGDGTKTSVGPGDAIFVGRGTINRLSIHGNLKKIFAIVEGLES